MTHHDTRSRDGVTRQTAEFRAAVRAARDRIRAAPRREPDDLRALASQLRMPLIKALMAFVGHPEGTRGQAWGSLVERATLQLEQAANEEDADKVLTLVGEAEGLLALALSDMNS